MGGISEKEMSSKAGFLQKLTQRLRALSDEKQREAQTRKLLSQDTSEPPEVVGQRTNKRLGSPEIRKLLASKLSALQEQMSIMEESEEELLLLYKAHMEVGSIMLFGAKYQEIDLDTPLVLSDKDTVLVENLKSVVESLREGNKVSALERLRQIPEPFGSKCDQGEFDGYNHEVLIVSTTSASMLRDAESKIRQDGAWEILTEEFLSPIVSGFDARNRLTVARGVTPFLPSSS